MNKFYIARAIDLLILILLFKSGFGQEKIEIIICDNFKKGKSEFELIKISSIKDNDTIPFLYLGENMYLNILYNDKNVEIKDTTIIPVFLENCKYIYILSVFEKDFTYPFIEFCFKKGAKRSNEIIWSYTNYSGRHLVGIGKRIKKKT